LTGLQTPIRESYWVVPGRFLAGEYPGSFEAQTARWRVGAFLEAGINAFIDLTQPGELVPYEPILEQEAETRGLKISYQRFPIRDGGLPAPELAARTLDAIDNAMDAGKQVYVHCWGGVGRTGTIIGCHLVRHGLSGQQALDRIAQWWAQSPKLVRYPRSPETDQQVRFILDWRE
jgi:hypothetical protein